MAVFKKRNEDSDSIETNNSEKKKSNKKVTTKASGGNSDKKKKSAQATKSGEKPTSTKKRSSVKRLGGLLFAKMMRGGASELRANAEEVNRLNIFPVPDGDTGDNMRMTIESGIAALETVNSDDLAEVMRVVSKGMLLGARGNSGVILSQLFAGMAKSFESAEEADPTALGKALEKGVEQAYTSVMTPTEGTILTVAREAVEYAVKRINPNSTIRSLFGDLVKEMHASLERTPDILAVLKEAGVVDSGGAGLFYIMDGLNRVLNGEEIEYKAPEVVESKPTAPDISAFGPDSEMTYGYCTELLVQLLNSKTDIDAFDVDALKVRLAEFGDSVVTFKTDSIVKVHVHTLTPERVLAYLRTFGEFITVKIENMSIQHTALEAPEEPAQTKPNGPKKPYGVVMVSNGPGIEALFRELGADEVINGGQTNNPSTSDFLNAFEHINAEHIFVFPNNSNIIMAATQAGEIYENATIHIIPAKNIGAGYVALSSMNFDSSTVEELLDEAAAAISRVTSAYISPAVRDAELNGLHINDGDTIGISGKEVLVASFDRRTATFELAQKLLTDGEKFMLTVFCGTDASAEECAELENYIAKEFPTVEAYFIDGGQEIYPYIFVAE